jgi:hypothetical protein
MLDSPSKLKLRVLQIRVVDNHIRHFFRAALIQVHDLARHISTLVLCPHSTSLIMTVGIPAYRPWNCYIERSLNPDTKVPRMGKLRSLQKHTIE